MSAVQSYSMYLCYMDESGDPGVVRSPTPAYAVSALLLKDSAWPVVFEDVLNFRRYVRSAFGLRMRDEVKAAELVKGSGPWAGLGLGDRRRKDLFRSFLRLEAKTGELKTFAVVVDKAKCVSTDQVRELAWESALNRLERFSFYNKDTILLVPDVGEYEYRRKLARRMRRYAPVGSRLGTGSLTRPFVNLVDDPVQRKSHESYFIQLADLNAYAAFRRVHPTGPFPTMMWHELGSAILTEANRYKPGDPSGIVLRP